MICAWIYVRSGFGTWRMSREIPVGSRSGVGTATMLGARNSVAATVGALCTMGDAQHPHVHRTQNAGQPLSGDGSLAAIAHVSGITSALIPLESANKRASTAIRSARRIPIDGIPVALRSQKIVCHEKIWV